MSQNQTSYNTWRNFLLSHVFSFGLSADSTYTTQFKFNPNGNIDGYIADNEAHWELTDEKLLLKNRNLETTTEFILPTDFNFGIQSSLAGTFLRNTKTRHVLVAVAEKDGFEPNTYEQSLKGLYNHINVQNLNFLRDTLHLAPTVKRKNNSTIHIAFIINSVETLPALFPLITATIADQNFEVKIIAIDKVFRNDPLQTLEPLCKFLDQHLNYPYIKITNDFMNALNSLHTWNPDFIVRQSEWDADFPLAFSGANLSWTRLIHIPYTITEDFVYAANSNKKTLLANPYYQNIWRYFLPEELNTSQAKDIQSSFISTDCFSNVGSMKAIMIKNATSSWPLPHSSNPKVVWMAHHSVGVGWFNMGQFSQIYKPVLEWIKDHPNIDVVFNPHPLLEQKFISEKHDITHKDYIKFLQELRALPNAAVFKENSQYNLTAAADVILTDGISSIYELQIQRKKIVTLLRSDHAGFTSHGEQLLKGTYVIEGNHINQALTKVEELLTANNPNEQEQKENTANWLKNEHPERTIIEEMIHEIQD